MTRRRRTLFGQPPGMTERRAGRERSGVATRASFARRHWQPCEALISQ
jgi:hypothetical protein